MNKRLTIALPSRSLSRLEALRDLTEASSVSEVIKDALMTYEQIASHLSEGVRFQAIDVNGDLREVQFMIDVPVKSVDYERKLSAVS